MWYKLNEIERIQIELTNYCNAACPECEREQILNPYPYYVDENEEHGKTKEWVEEQRMRPMFKEINDRYLTLEQIKKRFKPGDWPYLESVHYCGNIDEPTINPEFMGITEHFHSLNDRVCIYLSTNGGSRNEKFWRGLGKLSDDRKPLKRKVKFLYETLSKYPYAENGADSVYLEYYPQQWKMHPDYGVAHGMAYGGITTINDRDIKVKENGDLYYNSGGFKVWFGIDGLEDTNHIYRRKVDWDRLQKHFRAYIKAGGDAGWQFIVFPWNEHQIEEARQRSLDEGFSTFALVQTVRNTGASIEGGRDYRDNIVNVANLNLSQEGVTGGRLKEDCNEEIYSEMHRQKSIAIEDKQDGF